MMHKYKTSTKLGVTALFMTFTCLTAQASAQDFEAVQPDLFAVKGSLSNAWGDYDNDGDLDLAVSLKGGAVRLYRNDDSTFVRVGEAMGLPQSGKELRGLAWGDYDDDGDLDLIGGSNVFPIRDRTYLFRNDGTVFTETAESVGLALWHQISRQTSFIDFDNDGDLDVYAADRSGANLLMRQEAGTYRPVPFSFGAIDSRRTVGACWADYDSDGDLDLFLANNNGDSDVLWQNQDGQGFKDVAPELGMDENWRSYSVGGVGCAWGDYDNDGDFDLYVGTYGKNILWRNDGDAGFVNATDTMGVAEPDRTVGAAWGDYDNDGDLDLFVVGYHYIDKVQQPLNLLYRNEGEGKPFTSVIGTDHLLNGGDHGVEWIDFDLDGALDLSLTDGYGPVGGHPLYRNRVVDVGGQPGINVLVMDEEGHFTHPGAEVRLYYEDGRLLGTRLVNTGGGYNTQSAAPVHFGLGDATKVDVEVTYLTSRGRQSQWKRGIRPADAANRLVVVRQSTPGN